MVYTSFRSYRSCQHQYTHGYLNTLPNGFTAVPSIGTEQLTQMIGMTTITVFIQFVQVKLLFFTMLNSYHFFFDDSRQLVILVEVACLPPLSVFKQSITYCCCCCYCAQTKLKPQRPIKLLSTESWRNYSLTKKLQVL